MNYNNNSNKIFGMGNQPNLNWPIEKGITVLEHIVVVFITEWDTIVEHAKKTQCD